MAFQEVRFFLTWIQQRRNYHLLVLLPYLSRWYIFKEIYIKTNKKQNQISTGKKKESKAKDIQPTFLSLKILYFHLCCATLIIKTEKKRKRRRKKDFTVECLFQYFSDQRNCETSTWQEKKPTNINKIPWPIDVFWEQITDFREPAPCILTSKNISAQTVWWQL